MKLNRGVIQMWLALANMRGSMDVNLGLLKNPCTRESYPLELIVRVGVIAKQLGWMVSLRSWE